MEYRKFKIMAIFLISFNIVSSIIAVAQELIVTKSEVNDDSKAAKSVKVENKEKHYVNVVGKSNPTDIVNIPDIQFKRSLNQSLHVKDKDSDITINILSVTGFVKKFV